MSRAEEQWSVLDIPTPSQLQTVYSILVPYMVKTQPHSSVAKRDSWRPGTGLRVSSLCSEPSFYSFPASLEDCLFANGVDSGCQGLPAGGVSCLVSGIIQAASAPQSFVAIPGRGPADDTGAPATTVMPEVLLPVSALHLHPLLHSSRAGIITLPSRGRNCGRQVMQLPEGCSLTGRKECGLLTCLTHNSPGLLSSP